MKNFLQAIILILVIISFSQLTTPKTLASINDDDADYLLGQSYHQWISRDNSQRFVIRSVYEQGINRGLTHQQALNEARAVFASVNNTLNSNNTANIDIVSNIPGLGWHFTKEENGNLSVSANTTNNFQPSVPEGLRNRDAILIGLEHDSRYYGQYPDNDEDVHNGVNQIDNSQSQDNPTLAGQQIANQTPGQTTAGGATAGGTRNTVTTDCGSEGLAGQRFLFFHGPLVPCGINKHCASDTGGSINKPCTICHFFVLIQNFFNLLLSLLIVVSIFMLTVAGVLYIISAGGKMATTAKEIIHKTLLGFGLFLLSWLIVFTLLKLLAVNTSMLGTGGDTGWFQFTCDDESAFWIDPEGTDPANPNNPNDPANPNNPTDPANPNNPNDPANPNNPSPQPPNPVTPTPTEGRTEEELRAEALSTGARAQNDQCIGSSTGRAEGCVSFVGAKPATIQGIKDLATKCHNFNSGCVVQTNSVTDRIINPNTGEEYYNTVHDGNANCTYCHHSGDKVDYQANATLNRYLTGLNTRDEINNIPVGEGSGALVRIGTRNGRHGGPKFRDRYNNVWVYEAGNGSSGGHWDVCYAGAACPEHGSN